VIVFLVLFGLLSAFLDVTVVTEAFLGMLLSGNGLTAPSALLICFVHPDLPFASPPASEELG
jgi:hypothetical protein